MHLSISLAGFILKVEVAIIAFVSNSHLYFLVITLGTVAILGTTAGSDDAIETNKKKHDATATTTEDICI